MRGLRILACGAALATLTALTIGLLQVLEVVPSDQEEWIPLAIYRAERDARARRRRPLHRAPRRAERAAPAVIAADVEAETEWFRTRWSDVVAEFDYDLRGIYLDGTPEDLTVFNRTHPDVLEHASRNVAYEEQVCEG